MSTNVDPVEAFKQARHASRVADDVEDDELIELPDELSASDAGNAARLIRLEGRRLRHVHAWQKWLVYDDGRWHIDLGDALVSHRAKAVGADVLRQSRELTDDKAREAAEKFAKRCENASAIGSMLTLARGIPGVLVDHEQLDAHPTLLNVLNCTIDLETGKARDHEPDDLMTKRAPVVYDEESTAPLWESCLERWQPDPAVRDYLQRMCGSAITGHPVERLFVNHGVGGNGKSKFYGAIAGLLGSYSVVPHKSLLVAQRHQEHQTVVASLFGARMLVVPETEADDRLNEALVKNLTGGDTIRARRIREDEWDFKPTWTAFMHTNYRPVVSGADEGIWRRLRLIPWETIIPTSQQDPRLGDKLASEESGILNWLIAGAVRWLDGDDSEPADVIAATADYRDAENVIGRFVDECCVTGPGKSVPVKKLGQTYTLWCQQNAEDVMTSKALGQALEAMGFRAKKGTGGVRIRLGLGLIR